MLELSEQSNPSGEIEAQRAFFLFDKAKSRWNEIGIRIGISDVLNTGMDLLIGSLNHQIPRLKCCPKLAECIYRYLAEGPVARHGKNKVIYRI
ncbi:hypothetical protein [Phyllobacterium zundukense]|uniref:Uncharacterized protein n=1 Tax=Phyllobacterium zundukense TaxID=1867719 RepID=A0ACD4D9V4_9HYPH|nr:hypothetical protein [Phyllobacterium zundukense]UXN62578.1 hypothetical protein N8E88_21770 [Phyllobacterium zundukense]